METVNSSNQRKMGVILSYVSLGLSNAVGLIIVPFMLRALGQSQYGLYQLIGSFVGYLTILDFGMATTVMRYVAAFRAKNDRIGEENFLANTYIIYGVIVGLVIVVGYAINLAIPTLYGQTLSAEQISDAQIMFVIVILNLVLSLMAYPLLGTLKGYEQFIFPGAANIVKVALEALTIFAVLSGGGHAIAVVLVESFYNVAYFGSCAVFALVRCHVRVKLHHFELSRLREIFSFSFFVFLEAVVNQIFWKMDQSIIGLYVNTSFVAIYAIGVQMSVYYRSLGTNIAAIAFPMASRMEANKASGSDFTDILIRIGRMQLIILGVILSGFILFGRTFIHLWAGPAYDDAYGIALVVLIPVTIPLVQNLMFGIMKAKNQHRFYAVLYLIVAVLNIPLTILFVNLFGYGYAAVSTAIMLVISTVIIMNWYYHRHIGVDIPRFFRELWYRLGPAILVATLIGVVINFIPDRGWFILFGKISLYCIAYAVSLWFIGMNAQEKAQIEIPIRTISHRISRLRA